MFSKECQVRVRYSETDKMGYVYYGNYAQYYEVARVEAMRELGMSYLDIENSGVMMPVVDLKVKYIAPAFYDDLLTVKCIIKDIPKLKIHFEYEIYNADKKLINIGSTSLVFIDQSTSKVVLAPNSIVTALQSYI